MRHPARLAPQFWPRAYRALPVVLIALLAVLSHASAHSWYPPRCCSGVDCFSIPIPRTEIERRADGWFLKKEGITSPFNRARPSEDRQFHLCRDEMGKGKLITPKDELPCFFVPEPEL